MSERARIIIRFFICNCVPLAPEVTMFAEKEKERVLVRRREKASEENSVDLLTLFFF